VEDIRFQRFGDPFQHGDPDFPARNNAVVAHNITCANSNCDVDGGRVIETLCVCLRSDADGSPHTNGHLCQKCNDALRTYNLQTTGQSGPVFEEYEVLPVNHSGIRAVEDPKAAIDEPAVSPKGDQGVPPSTEGVKELDPQQDEVKHVNDSDFGVSTDRQPGGEVADPPRRSRARGD
jgi:hypothetical protein